MLRAAVMLDSLTPPRWVVAMLHRIQLSSSARIEALLMNGAPPDLPPTLFEKLIRRWYAIPQSVARRSLEFLHENVLDGKPCLLDPFAPEPLPSDLQQVPKITLIPLQRKFSDYIQPADVTQIASLDLDVILRIGFRILRGPILTVPRYGVWSLHHGNNEVNRGGPAGFWESLEGWPTTGVTLQVLNEDLDNGTVLARVTAKTDIWSVRENRANLFWKSANLMPRKLDELHRRGPDEFARRVAENNQHPKFYSRRLYTHPSTGHFARMLVHKSVAKVANYGLEKSTKKQWELHFALGDTISTSFWRFRRIIPPANRYYADPHILTRDGKYYVFFEDFCRHKNLGRISVLTISQQGVVSEPVPVLEHAYHLSYPFVFDWEGETYMIPESGANRTVTLYRCIQFPDKWEPMLNLMDHIHHVDCTLHFDGERWWMFAGHAQAPRGSQSDEAVLYYAKDFRTRQWTPHVDNPILEDVTCSRPAGALFQLGSRLYRPVQNCSRHYGWGFQLCHVDELTPTRYRQSVVSSVTPDWHSQVISTHTFNYQKGLTIIDAETRHWRWASS